MAKYQINRIESNLRKNRIKNNKRRNQYHLRLLPNQVNVQTTNSVQLDIDDVSDQNSKQSNINPKKLCILYIHVNKFIL